MVSVLKSEYYPEPGDWVQTTRDIEEMFFILNKGAVGRMLRQEWDHESDSQSAHDLLIYVVQFGTVEVRCRFMDVVSMSVLDQIARELDRD